MNILILGSRGSLGRQLVKIFRSGNQVTAWDKDDIDITDQELVFKKINDVKPDIIINAAAQTAVDKCEESKDEYKIAKKINSEAVEYLAEAAIGIGAILVHYSTDYVFGGNGNGIKVIEEQSGFQENSKPGPVNKYGESKLLGEQALIKRSGQGLKWYLIRTSKLFGPRGESAGTKLSFFDLMLALSKEKKSLEVIDEEVSCFTYAPDLARATRKLVESRAGYGIYHITNSGSCTWYQAAVELFKIANINIKVNPVTSDKFPRLAKRPKYSVLLNTKLEPLRSWQKALEEYLAKRKNKRD